MVGAVPGGAEGLPASGGRRPVPRRVRAVRLLEPESPYVRLDPERAAVLTEGAKAGQSRIEELMKQIEATPEGWQVPLHVFDYNLDHFEIGTIDSPEWKIDDRSAPTSCGPSRLGRACGATTATRPRTR